MHPPYRRQVKKKKRINTSGVCLLPVSSTDYLRTIRLHSAFFGADFALTELQENVKEDGSVLQQAATAADGGGAARVIPPPSRPRHRYRSMKKKWPRVRPSGCPCRKRRRFLTQNREAPCELPGQGNALR